VVEQAAIAGALRPSVAGNPAEAEVVADEMSSTATWRTPRKVRDST
jgi:hypothetical protein